MHGSAKTALHHWWPKGLSALDGDGCITSVAPDGKEIRTRPKSLGAITNAHTVKLDDAWSFSFESEFNEVDDRLPHLVRKLLALESPSPHTPRHGNRFLPHTVSDDLLSGLASSLASLIVRSPRHRNLLAGTTEYYQSRFGFPDPQAHKNLIALNLRNKMDIVRRNFSDGKYVVAFSDDREFIFEGEILEI